MVEANRATYICVVVCSFFWNNKRENYSDEQSDELTNLSMFVYKTIL